LACSGRCFNLGVHVLCVDNGPFHQKHFGIGSEAHSTISGPIYNRRAHSSSYWSYIHVLPFDIIFSIHISHDTHSFTQKKFIACIAYCLHCLPHIAYNAYISPTVLHRLHCLLPIHIIAYWFHCLHFTNSS